MKTLRTTASALACVLILGIGTTSADTDKDRRGMQAYHGHMGMMGPGHGPMTGYGPGPMPVYIHGWMGHGPGWMMGPGHGRMAYGPGHKMGHGYRGMMGHGKGAMHRRGGMDPDRLSDEMLDHIGERIAARHRAMQEIATETDPAARRQLVREHLKSRQARRGKYRDDDDDDSDDVSRRGYGGGGMMGGGMMGPGMMGPGMMGGDMMGRGQLSDEQLDQMSEHMAENYKRMQQLAETTDKDERRKLMREHFESMQGFMGGMHRRR